MGPTHRWGASPASGQYVIRLMKPSQFRKITCGVSPVSLIKRVPIVCCERGGKLSTKVFILTRPCFKASNNFVLKPPSVNSSHRWRLAFLTRMASPILGSPYSSALPA